MSKILVIGDTHFDDRYHNYLDKQLYSLYNLILTQLYNDKDIKHIVFLGDIFDKRHPKPSVILGVSRFFKSLSDLCCSKDIIIHILRGNHDSEDKSDNEVTILSVLDGFSSNLKVHVTNNCYLLEENSYIPAIHFMPHYEDESITINYLKNEVKEKDLVFGHFAYKGCVNDGDSYDFTIDYSTDLDFGAFFCLGHIHSFHNRGCVTILGTPYPTSFQERKKKTYVTVVDITSKPVFHLIETFTGPRFYEVENLDDLKNISTDELNIFTYVRVIVDPSKTQNEYSLVEEIRDKYGFDWVDVKFKDLFQESKYEPQSYYKPDRQLFSINEAIIEEYVDKTPTSLSKEELMNSLKLIE